MEESKKQMIEEKLRKLLMAKDPDVDETPQVMSLPTLTRRRPSVVKVIRRRKGAADMHIA